NNLDLVSASQLGTLQIWDMVTRAPLIYLTLSDLKYVQFISVLAIDPHGQPPLIKADPSSEVQPGVEDRIKDSTNLLLLVKREQPVCTGLIRVTFHSQRDWDVTPLCWFPPHLEARCFS